MAIIYSRELKSKLYFADYFIFQTSHIYQEWISKDKLSRMYYCLSVNFIY